MICEWWALDYGLVKQRSAESLPQCNFAVAPVLALLTATLRACVRRLIRLADLARHLEPVTSVRTIQQFRDVAIRNPVFADQPRRSPSCSLHHGFRSGSAAPISLHLPSHLSCRRPSQILNTSQAD